MNQKIIKSNLKPQRSVLSTPSTVNCQLSTVNYGLDADYWNLKTSERLYVSNMMEAIKEVFDIKNAGTAIMEAYDEVALSRRHLKGFSSKTLQKKYAEFKQSNGDWRVLVRNWKGGKTGLPQEFKNWFISMALKPDRYDATQSVCEVIKRLWLNNIETPGYGRPIQWWAINRPERPFPRGIIMRLSDFPEGWSDKNLKRLLPKNKATIALNRRGYHHAHDFFREHNWRDTSKLKPLELITFDDVRLDIMAVCEHEGKEQICYVNAIFALDVASRKILHYLVKPRLKREDDTHLSLARSDTKTVLLSILSGCVPADYKMNILMENASATLEASDRNLLQSTFSDMLEFQSTGLTRFDLSKSCGFIEKGGQAWFKGWIEALFRKLHTTMNLLDGTTGNRYDNKPGELENKMSYTLQVLRTAKKEGVNIGNLWLPLLTMEQLNNVLDEIVLWINNRSDHKLQGFDYADEFQHSQTKAIASLADLQVMSPEDRIGWIATKRPESPVERWDKLTQQVNMCVLPKGALLPFYNKTRNVKVRNGRIELTVKSFSNDKLIYTSRDLLNYENNEFFAGISDDYSSLNLWDKEGRFVVSVDRITRTNVADKNATLKRSGEVHRSREIEHYAPAREYRKEEVLNIIAGKTYNESILPSLSKSIEKKEDLELKDRPNMLKTRKNTLKNAQSKRLEQAAITASTLNDDFEF